MKTCAYCGCENPDNATQCRGCGTSEFAVPAPPPTPPQPPKVERLVNAADAPSGSPTTAEAGETVLCTSCLFPNPPERPFCKRCGAPVSFISTIGPLEVAYAEGFAYRQAVQGRPKPIVLIGMWLIFFPGLLVCLGGIIATMSWGAGVGLTGLAFFWVSAGFGTICSFMLYRVTKNYLTIPKRNPEGSGANQVGNET